MPGLFLSPGKGPVFFGPVPPEEPLRRISGVTRDANGAALGGCTVQLFRTRDDLFLDEVVSDGSGNYIIGSGSPTETYYIVAYLAGSPDVTGATLNTLIAT